MFGLTAGCHGGAYFSVFLFCIDDLLMFSAALGPRGLATPVDVYLEGSDQHRGWFQVPSFSLHGSFVIFAVEFPVNECCGNGSSAV